MYFNVVCICSTAAGIHTPADCALQSALCNPTLINKLFKHQNDQNDLF